MEFTSFPLVPAGRLGFSLAMKTFRIVSLH